MMRTLINISFCAGHFKGRDPDVAPKLDGALHARWLLDCVRYWRQMPHDIAVSMTAWNGLLNVEAGEERDTFWRINEEVDFLLGVPQNPSHQIGAALCIRQGLECASKLGYDCMVHTAEDVACDNLWQAMDTLLSSIHRDYDYCGEAWGEKGGELNAQFFACRANALAGAWDACRVPEHGCIERYLYDLLDGRPKKIIEKGLYQSTHDYNEWCRWKDGEK